MLTYELAKKLKEAGFNQKHTGWCKHEVPALQWDHKECYEKGEYAYFPTLSELIEACGDKLWKIEQINNQWYCFSKKDGVLMPGDDDIEESIAQFWLSLN